MKSKTPGKNKTHPCVVAIGASAGGTAALKELFAKADSLSDLIIIVAQHLDESGNQLAVEVLRTLTHHQVEELKNGGSLKAGRVYSVPPHSLVAIKDGKPRLTVARTPEKKLTVIDSLFGAIAKEFGELAIGIVLSGESRDGAAGVRALNESGGLTLAQTPDSSEHPSMPESAIATECVDHILPLGGLWREVTEYAAYVHGARSAKNREAIKEEITSILPSICETLQKITRHDFKHYKNSTLLRRIQRRMQVLQIVSPAEYLELLETKKDEVATLFRELLINVTSFFRDAEAFEALREEVLLPLLNSSGSPKVRIWVPGCSTGEEAYSLAILVHEILEKQNPRREVQIIATDLDDAALNQARRGVYSATIAEHVSEARLAKYFVKKSGRYHVKKEIRELCLFSVHNLINDPPFSQLDLISCRNVLIYLGPHLQKKLFPVFHYALRPGGYLFLGTSETLTSHRELFKPVSSRYRIAQRKPTAIKLPSMTTSVQNYLSYFQGQEKIAEADLGLIGQRIALDEMPLKYAIVNDEAQILFAAAGLNKYVQITEGQFQNNIVKLVSTELRSSLRAAFNAAKKEKRKISNDGCTIKTEQGLERTCVIVQPMPQLGDMSELYWIAFQNMGLVHHSDKPVRVVEESDVDMVDHLERELSMVRQELDKSVQDLEASNEELKSSNEELLSMNEELQSANEELEASKEEVQFSNEALQRANLDLENLLASTQIATLFLDDELKIRGFTPSIKEIYSIESSDIGRPVSDFTTKTLTMPAYPDPSVLHNHTAFENEVRLQDSRIFLRRILPYKNSQDQRDGMVVTFIDITELHMANSLRKESEKRFQVMADTAPVLVWISGIDGKRTWFNKGWMGFTGKSMEESLHDGWMKSVHPEDLPVYLKLYDEHFKSQTPFQLDYRLRHKDGGYRWIDARIVPRFTPDGKFEGCIGACLDIHEKKTAQHLIESSEAHFRSLVDHSPAMMWMTDKEAKCTYLSKQWYEVTGRTPEQDLGFGWVENVHPDDRKDAETAFFTAYESRGLISIRYRLRHKDGTYRWSVDSGLPLFSSTNEFQGYIGTVIDIDKQISALADLEALRARFQRSAEATDLGVWYCDLPFDELIWNKEVKNHFHMDPHRRVTIDDFYAYIHPEDRERTRAAIQHSIDSRTPYDTIYRTVSPQTPSSVKWIRAIGWTDYDKDGKPIRFDGITLDVTKDHIRSLELRNAKDEAVEMRRQAELASASKTRFLANMSHEIRTPLSAIVGFGELLQNQIDKNSEAHMFAERILRNSVQLRRLIDELLDLSKIEAEKIEIENVPVNIDSLIEDVFSTLELKAQEKGIVLDVKWASEKLGTIVTDPIRFSQILNNVIGNAVKFTESGRVGVEFKTVGDKLRVRVEDSGIGLEPEQQKRIFEPFMQADASVTRRFGGTGLGLSLSKRLANYLGGDLTLERSAPGKGSVFVIEIRINEPLSAKTPVHVEINPVGSLTGKKVLIVDDSPDNRLLVGLILRDTDAQVSEAANGQEALAKIGSETFDIILMDIQMPGMDGYQTFQKIREREVPTPVVALTAHAFKEERTRCLNAGFDEYITKPIDKNNLLRTIRKMTTAN